MIVIIVTVKLIIFTIANMKIIIIITRMMIDMIAIMIRRKITIMIVSDKQNRKMRVESQQLDDHEYHTHDTNNSCNV